MEQYQRTALAAGTVLCHFISISWSCSNGGRLTCVLAWWMCPNCPKAIHITWMHWDIDLIHHTPCTQGWVKFTLFPPCLWHFWLSLSVDPLCVNFWTLFVPLVPSKFWLGPCPVLYNPTPMHVKVQCQDLLLHKSWVFYLLWVMFPNPCCSHPHAINHLHLVSAWSWEQRREECVLLTEVP